jgi:NAD(P)-dependent dehydrogenase (short-subunit alcohol dehydrogenase family)
MTTSPNSENFGHNGGMEYSLKGKVAVVTGGSYGIGRAIAIAMAERGSKVYVGDRQINDANRPLFSKLGVVEQLCDLRDSGQVENWILSILGDSNGVDILINNAGIVMDGQIPGASEMQWDACMDINFKSTFLLSRLLIPAMQKQGGGSIVNISSNAGLLPRAQDPIYSTSKGALLSFTRALALCHAKDRIRVNAVCPGPVGDTMMIENQLIIAENRELATRRLIEASPMAKAYGRMISAEEVAQAVLYLVSDYAAMVTGTFIAIDGGKSLGVPPA